MKFGTITLAAGLITAATSSLAFAYNCDSDCRTQICRRTPLGRVCVPDPEYPICAAAKQVDCARRELNIAAEAWGAAGSAGYQIAAGIMAGRNPAWVSLTPYQFDFVHRFHADAVGLSALRIHYDAAPMDSLGAQPFVIVPGSDGQTFGDDIYIQGGFNERDCSQLALLAHEITHSVQARNRGGLAGFGYDYFKKYKEAGQNYRNNPMEEEAYAIQDQARAACQ